MTAASATSAERPADSARSLWASSWRVSAAIFSPRTLRSPGSYWSFYGANTFGITLIPMLFGIALLFWNGRSVIGWMLTAGGALFILAGVIANMHIYFQPTSLFNTLVMLILLVGGLGLIARSLRHHASAG